MRFPTNSQPRSPRTGFTLIELLVVVAIIVAIIAMVGPAMNSLKTANEMDRAASDISSMVQLCRSYAITNNTYVYLGIGEFDAKVSDSAVQTAATSSAGGRVAMVALASKDGTRHYSSYAANMNEVNAGWTDPNNGYVNGAGFAIIGRLQTYENLHIFDYGSESPSSGAMARPGTYVVNGVKKGLYGATPMTYHRMGHQDSDSVTQITYPLGANPRYTFKKVLQFDPEGLVRMAPKAAPSTAAANQVPYSPQGIAEWIEVGFVQTHGNTVPDTGTMFPDSLSQNNGNHLCVIIDGIKGTARTFRPGR